MPGPTALSEDGGAARLYHKLMSDSVIEVNFVVYIGFAQLPLCHNFLLHHILYY